MDNDLIVLVKKYFDKVNGNTYHSVQFEIVDNIYHSGKCYGYGRQYEETFKDMYDKYLDQSMHYDDKIRQYERDIIIKELINPKYKVIENCKAKELKQIHEYK